MAGELERIEVSILTGSSDRSAMTFTPGTPASPVSVGASAQWRLTAEGVAPVHLYLVFDGRSVHVASAAGNLPVLLAGVQVGTNWVPAQVPCELRFGGACLILRYVSRGGAFDEEERTVHDGGALWQAAQRAVQAAQANQSDPGLEPKATQLGGPEYQAPRPAAGMPAKMDLGATTPLADAQQYRDAVAKMISSSPPGAQDSAPSTVRAPLVAPATSPLTGTLIAPSPLASKGSVPPPAAPRTPSVPPVAATSPSSPSSPAQPLNLTPAKGGPPGTTATPPKTPQQSAAGEEKKGYWASASAAKKATLILMPFALVASYFMLQPPETESRPTVITHQPKPRSTALDGGAQVADAAPNLSDGAGAVLAAADTEAGTAPTAVLDVDGAVAELTNAADASAEGTTTAPEDKTEPPPKVAKLPKGKKTPERLALDAVAAGSFADAAQLYTTLAAAHPDDESYRQAARILRDKAGHN